MACRLSNYFNKKGSKKIAPKKRCGYLNDDCPYRDERKCLFDKDFCALKRRKEERRQKERTITRIVWFVIISSLFLIILFGLRAFVINDNTEPFWRELLSFGIGTMSSVLAASIFAFLADIPSWLKNYERFFANMLSSNSYLKTLDDKSLVKLRQDITTQIHKTSAPNMAAGLVKTDEAICYLFKMPYYERYMQSVMCHYTTGSDICEKEHVIEYKLINPQSDYEIASETIKLSNLIRKRFPDDKGISEFKMTYKIDDGEEEELKEFEMTSEPLDKKIEYYDTKVYLSTKNAKGVYQEGFPVFFKESVRIKYSYKITIDSRDRCFTKRLQHPAGLFILNYSCNNEDVTVHGQIIGTNLKQSNMSIHYHDPNSVSLVSYDWLLPDNGAVVVILDKKTGLEDKSKDSEGV